jgi:hypothetical protein
MPVPELRVWDGETIIRVSDNALWSLRIEGDSEWALYYKTRAHCRKSPETDLMQYVGMEDAEGEKIFGKDILRDEAGTLGLVWWNSDQGRYYLLHPDGEMVVLSQETLRWRPWRIAGNVHEDPHLMNAELSRLLQHLKGHTADVECPVCGGTDFEAHSVQVSSKNPLRENEDPLAIECTRCTHVMLFHMEGVA